jgi:protein-tyrosine phosphatase
MKAAQVADNIWIGNILALRDLPSDFTVITLLAQEKTLRLAKSILTANHKQIVWRLVDKPSATFLCPDLIQILSIMDESRPVLVHCAQGVSRSAAVCAAWLISRHHCSTLQQAMTIIRQARPQAQPNLGFLAALKAIERHQGNVETAMEEWNGKQKTMRVTKS